MPADFLQQLEGAIGAFSDCISGKARSLGRQIGGRAGLVKELTRGRQVVAGLDAIIQRAFRESPELLEQWRIAKRVTKAPGNDSSGSEPAFDIAPAQPPTAEAAAGRVA